jgi:lipopolysaccharide transport system permease protein
MLAEKEVTVYFPKQRAKIGFLRSWIIMIKNVFHFKDLMLQLFKRDFLALYKKSFLGITWVFISPLIGIVSWVLLNATGILEPGDVGVPYPAYVLLSTTIYGLFVGFFTAAMETLNVGAAFIRQVKFPHEVLLVKQAAQYVSTFVLTIFFVIIVLVAFGIYPSLWILLLPLLIIPIFFIGAGLGLIMSVLAVVAEELKRAATIIVGLIIYITPVIYASEVEDPRLLKIIQWNPLTYLVGNVRDLVLYGKMDHIDRFFYATLLALFVFLFSWRFFFISEDRVIEKIL